MYKDIYKYDISLNNLHNRQSILSRDYTFSINYMFNHKFIGQVISCLPVNGKLFPEKIRK